VPERSNTPELHRSRFVPDAKRSGLALCLSGGGYRAALFHLGVLRRLNELGSLGYVDTISGVSGGSILGGFLAQHVEAWPQPGERIDGFSERIAPAFRDFTRKNIRTLWIVRRPGNRAAAVESLQRHYEKDVIQLPLSGLPDRPAYVFSATDLSFGVNWTFRREAAGSYQAGYLKPPPADWPAAKAVAASSCFPPVFQPMPLDVAPDRLKGGMARDDQRDELVRDLHLSDGGVYDNMALEAVWKNHAAVLVSDGGAVFDSTAPRGLISQIARYLGIQGDQAGALRKRWLISQFMSGDPEDLRGVYFGIGSNVKHFHEAAEGYSPDDVALIARIRTDLDFFSDAEAGVLQNHGYLTADVAMRVHGDQWTAPGAPPLEVPFGRWAPGTSLEALRNSHKRRLFGRWRLLHGR
jgi:NTE family protein